jgi:Protein of unknown function (DUF1579)
MNNRMRSMVAVSALVALVPVLSFAADAPKSTAKNTAKTTTTTTTTTTTAAPAGGDAAQAQMMAEMMKNATPGPMHAALKNEEGTWNATVTSWAGGPQPTQTTGTETRTMILGGRFLATKFTGTFMGQPYEGWGLTGYDNAKSQVNEIWADNMATNWMNLSGTMSADGKTLTCTGSVPGMDGKPMDVRAETKFDTDTQMTYTMFGKMNGQDTKMMQIVYTKATTAADAQTSK